MMGTNPPVSSMFNQTDLKRPPIHVVGWAVFLNSNENMWDKYGHLGRPHPLVGWENSCQLILEIEKRKS